MQLRKKVLEEVFVSMPIETIQIYLSKQKLALLLAACAIFVALGIWMQFVANHPPVTGRMLFRNPLYLRIIGIVGIAFFGSISYVIFQKIMDKAPGLSITDEGIFDNSGALSVGFIPWADVIGIQEARVYNQIFVNVVVKNPEEYIAKQKNSLKRSMMRINQKSYGSAISISANGLKSSSMEIKHLLEERLEAYSAKLKS